MKHASTLAILALCSSPLLAQTTTWFHGGTNNSALFGVTPDASQAITWMDNWAGELNPDTANLNTEQLQVNRPNMFGQNESVLIYGFAGAAISALSSGDVVTATLHLRQAFSSANQTWNVVGISNADANWDNASMTWNTDGVDDWSGLITTLGQSTVFNYGTVTTTTGTDVNIALNITDAFKAYVDGSISGIALINLSNIPGQPNQNSARFNPYSNESVTASNRPGLLVTTAPVPEPSTALLGAIGLLAILRRRRPGKA